MAFALKTIRQVLGQRRDLFVGVPALILLLGGLTAYVFYPAWRAAQHWRAAEQALALRDFDQACAHLHKYLALHAGSAEGFFLLARTLRRAGRFDEGEVALEKASRLNWVPEQIELEEVLGRVQHRGLGDDVCERLLALVQANHPDQRLILEVIIQKDRETLRLDRAEKWLNWWVDHFPDDWLAWQWRAEMRQAFGQSDAARADYHKLLELRPDYAEVHLFLGLLPVGDRSQAVAAEKHLRHYLARHPDHNGALVGLARCQREEGHLEAAAATLQQVLDRHPQHGEAALLAGTIAAERGHHEAALAWLRLAEKTGTEPHATHFQLAQVLKRLGKTAEADAHQRRFQELAQTQRSLEKAVLAVLSEPGNAARYYEIGRLFVETGQGGKAERYFLAALRFDPAHQPSHAALADLYAHSPRPEHVPLAAKHRLLAKGGRK